jgi:hypothetical protein
MMSEIDKCADCGGELDPLYPHVCEDIPVPTVLPTELKGENEQLVAEKDAGYAALDAWKAWFKEQGVRSPGMADLLRLGMTEDQVRTAAGVIRARMEK